MVAVDGLVEAAEATSNPYMLSLALSASGLALREADPVCALYALRRGLAIAQHNGIRMNESIVAMTLGSLEAKHGNPIAALDCATLAIRQYHDLGNTSLIRAPLAWLAALLDRLERHEFAATIAGFASSVLTVATIPELGTAITHLRDVLGDQTYESLARKGETMSTSAMATYAYDQIEQARTDLDTVSE